MYFLQEKIFLRTNVTFPSSHRREKHFGMSLSLCNDNRICPPLFMCCIRFWPYAQQFEWVKQIDLLKCLETIKLLAISCVDLFCYSKIRGVRQNTLSSSPGEQCHRTIFWEQTPTHTNNGYGLWNKAGIHETTLRLFWNQFLRNFENTCLSPMDFRVCR